jgi:hypothetical protein
MYLSHCLLLSALKDDMMAMFNLMFFYKIFYKLLVCC